MKDLTLTRRQLLIAAASASTLSILTGCRASLPPLPVAATTPAADALLKTSADAHGALAFSAVHDVNVSYFGKWHGLVTKLQPSLVDAGFRGGSEERILLSDNLAGQSHTGHSGHKQVTRRTAAKDSGDVRVWVNDQEAHDDDRRHAAALVVDAYCLFLFGPMLIDRYLRSGRSFVMDVAGTEDVVDGKRRYECELLRIQMEPGLGLSDADQMTLYIDRETHLMRRVRFTLDGLESTRGALAEVDCLDPVSLRGIQWPTRFHERLLRPAPLKVHDWRLIGLDIDRGYDAEAISGCLFTKLALRPVEALRI